ncbi:hypothetical protein TWF506_007487 [Arthrobotrys conoides]|uniref:Uncharacterized protein n=1 Tax=Arthrobotrys conoides TaxID=74498 RepID=A0AAN8RZM1_9PEZI
MDPSEPGRCGTLPEPTELHRTLRWLTNSFFLHNLALKQDKVGPSPTEISRIDHAFGVIWTWMEASHLYTERRDDIFDTLMWVLEDGFRCFDGYQSIVGDLLAVYIFLRDKLEHVEIIIAKTQPKEHLEYPGSLSMCLDQFKLATPFITFLSDAMAPSFERTAHKR